MEEPTRSSMDPEADTLRERARRRADWTALRTKLLATTPLASSGWKDAPHNALWTEMHEGAKLRVGRPPSDDCRAAVIAWFYSLIVVDACDPETALLAFNLWDKYTYWCNFVRLRLDAVSTVAEDDERRQRKRRRGMCVAAISLAIKFVHDAAKAHLNCLFRCLGLDDRCQLKCFAYEREMVANLFAHNELRADTAISLAAERDASVDVLGPAFVLCVFNITRDNADWSPNVVAAAAVRATQGVCTSVTV